MTAPNADALYRLALEACEQDRIEEGVDLARRALASDANHLRSHKLLAMALSRVGRNEEALTSYDHALAIGPDTAGLLGGRGDVLAALGRPEEALASYDRAVAIDGGSVDDWCNRGALLHDLDRHGEAVASFDRALALAPDFAPAHFNRGNALTALGRHDEAVAAFERAITVAPDYAGAHNNRANALDQLGRPDDALISVERALAVDPGYRDALVTKSIILRKLGRPAEALVACDRALSVEPGDPDALTVRGDILIGLERFDDAIASFDKLIALDPGNVAAKWNKSLLCLGLGRFEEGWALYEHRWQGQKGLEPRPYTQPRWTGERLNGPLLLWGEQGIGDEIFLSGMIPDVLARTDELVMEVEPRLQPLFARSFPQVKVIPCAADLYRGPVTAQAAMGDIGGLFRASWASFPKRERGHLVPDPARIREYRARLSSGGKALIGLNWLSKAITGKAKSTSLRELAAVLRLPGCRFVDLQYGDTRAERDAIERELGVRVEHLDDVDNMNDLDSLAALIAACDGVVSVSNVTAHLAGAVGQKTWVMVPHGAGRLWFWFHQGEDSPWYPRVHLRRQQPGQAWSELVASFTNEIETFVAGLSARGRS